MSKFSRPQVSIDMEEYIHLKSEVHRLEAIANKNCILPISIVPNPATSFPKEQAFILQVTPKEEKGRTFVNNGIIGYIIDTIGLGMVENNEVFIVRSTNGKKYVQ